MTVSSSVMRIGSLKPNTWHAGVKKYKSIVKSVQDMKNIRDHPKNKKEKYLHLINVTSYMSLQS